MKVRMRKNLGTRDAQAIGVDATECQEGMEPTVDRDAGQWLVSRRMADELPAIVAVPESPMQAVPPAPMSPKLEPKPSPLAGKVKSTSNKES